MRDRLCVAGACLLAACVGDVGVSPAPPQEPPVVEPSRPPPPAPPPAGGPRLRRLTSFEYDSTVRDLLGPDSTRAPVVLPPDPVVAGFTNNAHALTVSAPHAVALFAGAQDMAARATAPASLGALTACGSAGPSETCARSFLARFGLRAWRRPLEDVELDRLVAVYRTGATRRGFPGGIELAIRALLNAPAFVYRIELGEANGWDVASRLSYLVWGSMPDEGLFDAARADALRTAAQREAQVRRMLPDPRTRLMARELTRQWLELDRIDEAEKLRATFPTFSPALIPSMKEEIARFAETAMLGGQPMAAALMSSPTTFVDLALGKYYGVVEVGAVRLAGRAGLVTLGGMMAMLAHANQTSPSLRGLFVREQILCSAPPAPPADVNNNPPEPSKTASARERFQKHTTDPACASCHALIDGIGFALEEFDGAGLHRTSENGRALDLTGSAPGTDLPGFTGGAELGRRLAASAQVRDCLARQWFRFARGREETEADAPSVGAIAAAIGNADLGAAILASVRDAAFLGAEVAK